MNSIENENSEYEMPEYLQTFFFLLTGALMILLSFKADWSIIWMSNTFNIFVFLFGALLFVLGFVSLLPERWLPSDEDDDSEELD